MGVKISKVQSSAHWYWPIGCGAGRRGGVGKRLGSPELSFCLTPPVLPHPPPSPVLTQSCGGSHPLFGIHLAVPGSTRANQPSLGLRPKLTIPLARERGTKAQSSKVNHQLKWGLPDPCSSHTPHAGRESQEEQLRQD